MHATPFRIATWNVNSIRMRLNQILDWLAQNPLDMLALQETKCEDMLFPKAAFHEMDYDVIFSGQKAYNGVALIAKKTLKPVPLNAYFANHEQKRVIATEVNGCLVVNVYVPNGQSVGSDKYQFKLIWLQELYDLLKQFSLQHKKIMVLGDFNIAPQAIDHPPGVKDQIMISDEERFALKKIMDLGLHDSFRLFNQQSEQYSWWDFRTQGFLRNIGYRIDHILVSDALVPHCQDCIIEKELRAVAKASDHAPVVLTLQGI